MFEHHPPLAPEAYCHGHNTTESMALTDHDQYHNVSFIDHFGNETGPTGFQSKFK